ncbi:hypothetical protein JW979_11565 [bacterium]|nr:hypothetical protein [candidate division CSSED10-310 bacterium]
MSILDFFRKKTLPPGDTVTQKAGLKLVNKNADPAARYQAVDTLAEIGTEEAIYCLLQRFTIVIGTQIPDEDEKKYVFDKIRGFGKKAINPIMKFLYEKEHAAQALQLMKTICNEEERLENLLKLVESFDPYYSKYPDKKIQTFNSLKEFRDLRIIQVIKPFLDDDDDDIRISAIDALATQGDEEQLREMFLDIIITADERPRVRIEACRVLVDNHWNVKGFRKQISKVLPEQFYLDGKGYLHFKSGFEPQF